MGAAGGACARLRSAKMTRRPPVAKVVLRAGPVTFLHPYLPERNRRQKGARPRARGQPSRRPSMLDGEVTPEFFEPGIPTNRQGHVTLTSPALNAPAVAPYFNTTRSPRCPNREGPRPPAATATGVSCEALQVVDHHEAGASLDTRVTLRRGAGLSRLPGSALRTFGLCSRALHGSGPVDTVRHARQPTVRPRLYGPPLRKRRRSQVAPRASLYSSPCRRGPFLTPTTTAPPAIYLRRSVLSPGAARHTACRRRAHAHACSRRWLRRTARPRASGSQVRDARWVIAGRFASPSAAAVLPRPAVQAE